METLTPGPLAEMYQTAAETELRVLGLVAELADPESTLSKAFYGPLGVEPTPLEDVRRPMAGHVALLKDETGHTLELDGETFTSGSFKRRGALLAALVACQGEEQPDTFVTASQGNHAIAVAMAAKALGKQAAIYCPDTLNDVKRAKLEELGAKVYTEGLSTLEDALNAAQEASEDPASHMIHPFNQAEVIAGQATVGLEIVRDLERLQLAGRLNLHTTPVEINVAVGGGGFITGVAIVLKYLRDQGVIGDNVRLVGAQMEGCDAARRCVDDVYSGGSGTAYFAPGEFNTACDSTAVSGVGKLTLPFLADRRYVQGFRVISPAALGRSMRTLTGVKNKRIEPAGALAYASASLGAAEDARPHERGAEPTVFVTPVCGANTTKATYERFQDYDRAEYESRMALLRQMHAVGQAAMLERLEQPVTSWSTQSTNVWSGPTAGLRSAN